MAKSEERIRLIGNTILEQARQESQAIRDAADREREAAIARYRDEVLDVMYGKIQGEIAAVKKECAARRAVARKEAHQKLLLRRKGLEQAVFAGALEQLAQYAATPAYREALLVKIKELAGVYDPSSATVTLRPQDADLQPQIQTLLPGCQVKTDPALEPGGFTLLGGKEGILEDHTLAGALRRERRWFLTHAGLKVTSEA